MRLTLSTPDGSPITSAANRALVAETLAAAIGPASDPFDTRRPYVSPDRTTAVSTLSPTERTDAAYDRVLAVAEQARAAGLAAEVGGSTGPGGSRAGWTASCRELRVKYGSRPDVPGPPGA